MNKDEQRAAALASLEPLFIEAERDGKWFHCTYQDLWLSPKQLRVEHQCGRFIWSAQNWSLRDPREHLRELERRSIAAQDAVVSFRKEIGK